MEKRVALVLLGGILMVFVALTVMGGCAKETYLDKEYWVKISNTSLYPNQKVDPFLCKVLIVANVTNPRFDSETRRLFFDKLSYLNVVSQGSCRTDFGDITILGNSFEFRGDVRIVGRHFFFGDNQSYIIKIRKLRNIDNEGTIYLLPAEKNK